MKKRKHTFRKILLTILFLAIVAGLAALPLLTANQAPEENTANVLAATVQRRNLVRTVSGGSSLLTDYPTEISIPDGVTVTRYLVNNGDEVREGDPIAEVDDVSVMTAVKAVQESLDTLSKSLQTAQGKIQQGMITSDSSGALYVNGTRIEDSKLSSYTEYLSLSSQHREYETLLLDLFLLHESGTVNAPCDGMVQGLDKSILKPLDFSGNVQLVLLGKNTPKGDDDNTYFCHIYGIVSIEGDTMKVQEGNYRYDVDNLQDLTWVDWNPSGAITELPLEQFAFLNNEGTWEVVTPAVGDILMYAFGSGGSEDTGWILKIGTYSPASSGKPGGMNGLNGLNGLAGMGGFNIPSFSGGAGRGTAGTAAGPSLYSTARTTLGTVTPMEKMYMMLSVDEQDISSLALGMQAQVNLDALPREQFTAVITQISPFGTNSGGSSKYSVELELDRDIRMLPGMNAGVTLTVEQLENVLTIPVAALNDQGTKTVVYTALDAKTGDPASPVTVELGLSDGEYVQILSGLSDGQSIRYRYYDTVEISNAVETRGMFGR